LIPYRFGGEGRIEIVRRDENLGSVRLRDLEDPFHVLNGIVFLKTFADQGPREASLLHEPWTSISGDAEDLRKSADLLDSLRKDIFNVFTAKSGLSAERVEALMAEETWLGADVKQAIRSRICGRRYGSISSCCDCILSIRSLTMDRPSASGPAARLALSSSDLRRTYCGEENAPIRGW
jgi:Clp protease